MNINKKILKLAAQARKFQITVNKNILDGKIKIPVHLAFGHEFVSSLIKTFFGPSDSLFLTHRNIHYTSIFSKNSKKIYENFSKKIHTKLNLGSMNYIDNNSCIKYTSSILANNMSVASGYAEANKGSKSIVFCITGDGAIEEGSFYESLLLCKSLGLRVIFIVENNNFSMATTIDQRRSRIDLKKLSNSMGIKYSFFKRESIESNILNYKKLISEARNENNPVICEFEIITLGAYRNNNKKIHYHHGPMKLDFDKELFVHQNKNDILYLLWEKFKNDH